MSKLSSNQWHQSFVKLMTAQPIDHLIADITYYIQDGVYIPATISKSVADNCYAVSPLTLIAGYALDEIPKIDNYCIRIACVGLVKSMRAWLSFAKLDCVQTLNNQCLSTNMYSQDWRNIDIVSLRQQALNKSPNTALVLRSLNAVQHSHLIKSLNDDNWVSLVTRQVYLQHQWQNFSFNRDLKKDMALLNEQHWQFKPLSTLNEYQRAKELYDLLYLDKYSQNNIHFTVEYLQHAVEAKMLSLFGLFYRGEMLATLGMVIIDGDMTCPIFGYQTNKSQKLGLYRRISAFSINYAKDNNLRFNMSSGAPTFKVNRKAIPCIEYSFIYTAHLPWFQRMTWRILSGLGRVVYRPVLIHYKL